VIIDFGLAKLVEPLSDAASAAETQRPTEVGVVLGTTAYMSPEQAKGEPSDHRSDVFALGIVLYEMLSGETPFKRASAIETMNAIINEPDAAVKLVVESDASSELHRILHKCLAKFRATAIRRAKCSRLVTFAAGSRSRSSPVVSRAPLFRVGAADRRWHRGGGRTDRSRAPPIGAINRRVTCGPADGLRCRSRISAVR
jgi:serine/threonine protein kinase